MNPIQTSIADYFTKEQEQTARFAKALGHPVRIAILELLNSQACCYHGDMAEELPIAKSTLSQHLNELKDAGLIQGDITPPTTKYCINRENFALAKSLLNKVFESFWEKNSSYICELKPQNIKNMTEIKILGPGCQKCKTTYNNVLEALKQTNIEANVVKVEDIEEMMKYNVLTTPALVIDDQIKIKGRVAQVNEIVELLKK